MTTASIFQTLAGYSSALNVDAIPEATIQRVDWVVMDLVASTFAALGSPNSRKLWAYAAASQGGGDDAGTGGPCLLWGTPRGAAAGVAAMVNGANGYEAEFDDGNTLGGHWGSSSIPAVMALAERDGAGADDVIAAIVAAYELGDRISRPFSRKLLEGGVHFPGMMGLFGAIAGAARMLRLSPEATAKALAMSSLAPVAPYYPGLVGAESKAMYSGWPNACGIQFTELAAAGFGGPPDLLEGDQGLAHIWGWEGGTEALLLQILSGLGTQHALDRTYFKPYPCCRWLHPVIQAVGEIIKAHGIASDDIARIRVQGPNFVGKLYMVQGPFATPTQAKYSLPYCAAVAALDTQVGEHSFEAGRLADARLAALSEAVEFVADEGLERAFPACFSVAATVTTRQGQAWTQQQLPKWSAEQPPTFDQLAEKFMLVMSHKCGASLADQWLAYFRRGLRADPSMRGFFTLMRESTVAHHP